MRSRENARTTPTKRVTGTVRVVVIALLATTAFVVAAPAATAASSSKYCNAVTNLSAGDPDQSNANEMKTLAKSFRKAAKQAPEKIESAMNTIADYYEAIGSAGSNPAKVASALSNLANYTKASGKWAKYTAKTCI